VIGSNFAKYDFSEVLRVFVAGSGDPGAPCPRGHYCSSGTGPLGSSSNPPTPCHAGTYTAEEGARSTNNVVVVNFLCDFG